MERSRYLGKRLRTLRRAIVPGLAVVAAFAPTLGENASEVRQRFMEKLGSGARLLDQGNAQAAAEDLCWSARRGLNSHRAHLLCGIALTQARQPEEAIEHLELASELDDDHLATWVALGDAYLGAGRVDRSRASYYRALEIRTDYAPAYVGLGELAVRRDDEKTALEMFAKALQANPAEVRALVARARLHVDAGREDQALEDLREAVQLRPDDGIVQRALARVLQLNGLTQEAIGAARKARELRPQDARVAALLARIYLDLDAVPEAEEEARKALELDRHLVPARVVLADVLGRTGRLDKALEVLQPPDPSLISRPQLQELEQARERWQARQAEIERLRARLETREDEASAEPLDPPDRVRLARALLETGRPDQAVEVARPLVGEGGLPDELRRQVGKLMLDAGRPLEASELLEPLAPGGTPADRLALARALERSGAAERAAELYRGLAGAATGTGGASTSSAQAHAGLARIAWWNGNLQRALEHLRAHADAVSEGEARARSREAIARIEGLLELRSESSAKGEAQ